MLASNIHNLISFSQQLSKVSTICPLGFPGGDSGKEPAYQHRRHKRHGFDPWVGKIPWRRKWQPTPVCLPGKSHGQWSLASYSPWDRTELDSTEATTHTAFVLI